MDQSFLTKTDTKTECGWKGTASYYTLHIDGKEAKACPKLLPIDFNRSRVEGCRVVLCGTERQGSEYQGPCRLCQKLEREEPGEDGDH